MAYWIFKCNPDRYRLSARLSDPESTTTWTVTRYRQQIGPGDTVFLWETGPNRGIRAVMNIDEAPCLMLELESEQKYWESEETEEAWRVVGTLTHRFLDLSHRVLRETPGLENLSMFHGYQQGTNYAVTEDEGRIIMRLVEKP